jgi:hypothetical protein
VDILFKLPFFFVTNLFSQAGPKDIVRYRLYRRIPGFDFASDRFFYRFFNADHRTDAAGAKKDKLSLSRITNSRDS